MIDVHRVRLAVDLLIHHPGGCNGAMPLLGTDNFWTYSYINSLRELPGMKAWAAKYMDAGLGVIGVLAPEFGFETDLANVKNAVADLKVPYGFPV
jgi:hypothetical protein